MRWRTDSELDSELGRPGPDLVAEAAEWPGDVLVLGAGGKIGAGVAAMARRALDEAGRTGVRVRAVSRWGDPSARERAERSGVELVSADLSDPAQVAALPDAAVVIHLIGAKFGTADAPERAWMTNTVLPAYVAHRYPRARIVALSTGNVYGMVDTAGGGSTESDEPRPLGDYAVTCRGREQVFRNTARVQGTPVALVRLNYACEPRYGVLADIARTLMRGEAVDRGAGAFNVVWQRYANEVVLRCIARARSEEPFTLNLTGPETAEAGGVAARLAARLGCTVALRGEPPATALIADATLCHSLFGYPDLPLGALIDLQADWIAAGNTLWDRPTSFDRRDGRF